MTKYLGIDFGIKRVGLAISDGQLASPWKVIEGKGVNDLIEKIKKEAVVFEELVIGMPEGQMGVIVKKVIKDLGTDFTIIEADETLSSQNASKLMIELGVPRNKRKVDDAHSAAIILQNYLDTR